MTNTRSSGTVEDPACVAGTPRPVWAPTLFDSEPIAPDEAFRGAQRTVLRDDAWIDHVPGWLHGAAAVFDDLAGNVPWRSGRRLMYGRFVDEPRLSAFDRVAVEHCEVAGPVIDAMAGLLSRRYGAVLANVGLNYYRDGDDSVAWHGDRIARDRLTAIVAIVSVGGHRPFRLRPRAGGETRELRLGGGDLLVMGGACQRTWYHCVPKVRSAPPRISISFRPDW
jgi:alkylated DNA repair dioxygenase AlkB